jgi:hypothetical protein
MLHISIPVFVGIGIATIFIHIFLMMKNLDYSNMIIQKS